MQSAVAGPIESRPDYSPGSSRTTPLPRSYHAHIVWTKYLERIITGEATNYTPQERLMAEEWDRIKYDLFINNKIWDVKPWDRKWELKPTRRRAKAAGV